jgi:hypothetical protein
MSKLENSYRSDIVAGLAPLLAFPVENVVGVGAPDICCLAGWIELKIVRTVPARQGSVLHVRIENSQRIWMRNWCRQGGPGWWLTHVVPNRWWLLTGGTWGADSLGFASLETVVFNSQPLHDTRGLNYEKLIRHLTKRGLS